MESFPSSESSPREGGINIADDAKVTARDIIGRDQIIGYTAEEVRVLLANHQVPDLLHSVISEPYRSILEYVLQKARRVSIPPFGARIDFIISKLHSLIAPDISLLNETEKFILLTSACVQHLFHEQGKERTQITVNDVSDVVGSLASEISHQAKTAILEVAGEISTVASARCGFDIAANKYNDTQVRNKQIRIRLLGVLLHLASFLNIDESIDPDPPPSLENAPQSLRNDWWKQAYVRGVLIQDWRVQLHFAFPLGMGTSYEPILVTPLSEELQRLIRSYDHILYSARINLNYIDPKVSEIETTQIPPKEWQQLKHAIETEQARRIKDRLQQDLIRAQIAREILISSDIEYAERMSTEGRNNEAALAYSGIADLLERSQRTFESVDFSTKAAKEFLQTGDVLAAAQRYIKAAQTQLGRAQTPQLAQQQIEEAEKLVRQVNDPTLSAEFFLVRSAYEFAMIRDKDALESLAQVEKLLSEIADERKRILILSEWIIENFMISMVREEWEGARTSLAMAFSAFPDSAIPEKVEVLIHQMKVCAILGDWNAADRTFDKGRELLQGTTYSSQLALLKQQYAVTLARRGSLQDAYNQFAETIELLNGNADAYTLAIAYQNMQFVLLQNGALFYQGFERDQARRIDLFNSTVMQNQGYAHESDANNAFGREKPLDGLMHIRLALGYYWRDGSWHGIQDAYKVVARIHEIDKNPFAALIATIRASDEEGVKSYAKILSSGAKPELLTELINDLARLWPAAREQEFATIALGILADVIPTPLLDSVVIHLLELLKRPEINDRQIQVRRQAAKALGNLAPQFTVKQSTNVIEIVLEQLKRRQFWTVTEELLKTTQSILAAGKNLEPIVYEQIGDTLFSLEATEPLDDDLRTTVVYLAHTALAQTRQQAIQFLREHTKQFYDLSNLASLGDVIPEEDLHEAIEGILNAINPKPKIEVSNGQRTITMSFGAVNPRSLSNFYKILPPALNDRVINGLLEAIINENNHLSTRAGAIVALGDLPIDILAPRANEVVDYLLLGAEGALPRSSMIEQELESHQNPFSNFRINTGNIEMTQMACLESLGKIYAYVNDDHKQKVVLRFVDAARDPNAIIRQGVAMALSKLESVAAIPTSLVLSLFVLLHDNNAETVAWACVAAGHLIEKGLLQDFESEVIKRMLKLATAFNKDVRVGTAIGLRNILKSNNLVASTRAKISDTITQLENDQSHKVRSHAM